MPAHRVTIRTVGRRDRPIRAQRNRADPTPPLRAPVATARVHRCAPAVAPATHRHAPLPRSAGPGADCAGNQMLCQRCFTQLPGAASSCAGSLLSKQGLPTGLPVLKPAVRGLDSDPCGLLRHATHPNRIEFGSDGGTHIRLLVQCPTDLLIPRQVVPSQCDRAGTSRVP